MANCKAYQKLTCIEKVELIGQLVHAVQNDDICFLTARGMINGAKARGVFDDVVILPSANYEANETLQLT